MAREWMAENPYGAIEYESWSRAMARLAFNEGCLAQVRKLMECIEKMAEADGRWFHTESETLRLWEIFEDWQEWQQLKQEVMEEGGNS